MTDSRSHAEDVDRTAAEERESGPDEYERFVDFFENAAVPMHWVGPDGTVLRANQAELDALGYDCDEYVGHHIAEFHADQDVIDDILDRLHSGEVIEDYEARMRCKDGSIRHVLIDSSVNWQDGEFVNTRCVTRDITERKWRERELNEVQERMEFALTATDAIVWDWNVDEDEATFYPSPESLYGTAIDGWEDFIEVIHPEDRETVEREIEQSLETGEPKYEEVRIVRDGEVRWIEAPGKPVQDDDGATRMIGVARDITQRKRAQQDRRRSEERFRRLMEHSPFSMQLFDVDGSTMAANGAWEELWDASRDELDDYNILEDEQLAAAGILAELRDAFAGEVVELPLTHYDPAEIGKPGRDRWIEGYAYPLLQREEGAFEIALVHHDITDRKKRELELERYEKAVETVWDGITVLNSDDRFVLVNEAFCDLTGYDREEVIGEHATLILDESTYEAAEELHDEVLDGTREIATLEYDLHRADGETVPVEARFGPVRYADGSVGGAGVIRDVSERKERERALKESERRYRALADNFPNGGVGVFDRELRYTLVTGTMWDDIGPDAADLEGKPIREALPPDTADDVEPIFRGALDGEMGSVVSTLGGRTYRVWATPLRDADDEITGGLSFALDLTERLEREQQLETSNERLEQFAHAASHDLQEPLRMVSTYLQLIEKEYGDELDDEGQESLEFAVDGADRMREMIQSLLKYSRIETKGEPFGPVDVDEVLEDVLSDLAVSIEESGAEITAGDLPQVEGDADQLRQLLQNLLDNAIEYSGDEPPRVHVSAERVGARWVISVQDEGIGLEPADGDRVFNVFERLHTQTEHPGTGIGLALCERIVERHEGEIWVESEPGAGTTFSFTLPPAGDG